MDSEKTERFGFVLTPIEKKVVIKLAELEGGLTQAALIRCLIREAAQKRGVWPFKMNAADNLLTNGSHCNE